jgi:hypothetical protein
MNSAATLSVPQLTPWMPGPHETVTASVVLSVTEFVADRRLDLPGIMLKGLRMRAGWYGMPGAVGMWLWTLPGTTVRSGSISVWTNEADLDRFVNLPHHVAIMTRYSDRGRTRSIRWAEPEFNPAAVIDKARAWIAGDPG